ncbi:MAG: pilus assembly protein N-terminal domain-containing protein [Selenomonas sp.]|uniref:type II and III secretion system protein family protein n=1 Tax=Selenomonas sp. TaxID=2053611 RepID=UPI0025FE73BE|nr:pilus assembly protein N-terminal domain-containing protein [Selenomonas sp.]MCR5758493.1 pilus assembly protein N-terminal domain-containing protein [Selenomonas sp.]
MYTGKKIALGLAAVTAITVPAPAYAYDQPLWLGVNQSYYLSTNSAITRVAVGNPQIADVQELGEFAINIVAIKQGTTTINVWTADGMRQDFTVSVNNEDKGLAKAIERAINLPGVTVQMVGERVLLRGQVKNQYEKSLAFKVACLYVGDNPTGTKQEKMQLGIQGNVKSNVTAEEQVDSSTRVINLLEMENPDQINMEALVIEINSDEAKKLGITYASPAVNTTGSGITLGDPGSFYAGETYGVQRSKGSHWYNRNWLFTHFSQINAQLRLLIQQGKARVVSRPNITTMSGRSAGILVGGQIPYPVASSSSNNISVEYKPYGISLNLINPTVDRQGNVLAKIKAEVSRLDWNNSVSANGYNMPGLSTRSAQTEVTIPSGMTMAIGGLLNSEDSRVVQKVPILGNIPLLGELFKYHNDSRQKSEIIILLTPRVVNEQTPVPMSDKMAETFNDSRREVRDMQSVDVNGPVPEKPSKHKRSVQVQDEDRSLDNILPVDGSPDK